MTRNNRPTTIHAMIHNDAMTRLPRFFNGSEEHAMHELLQNGRRANATELRVSASPAGRIQVSDNGHGIANPAALLAFGLSDWEGAVVASEDAAGMGVFVLARWGCEIISRQAGDDAWRVTLTPEHFAGQGEAVIEWGINTPIEHGTIVSFNANREVEFVSRGLRRAEMLDKVVRHFPVSTWINGQRAKQSDFLGGAAMRESWKGIDLGVFRQANDYDRNILNFFGLEIERVKLASARTRNDIRWSVKADVRNAPDLELVLPARKEIVQNEFAAGLGQAARLTLFRAFAQADPPVDVNFDLYVEAAAAGIAVPEARPQLRPWNASYAESDRNGRGALAPFGNAAIVVAADMEPAESQVLMRAAKAAGLAQRLVGSDNGVEGYAWYDRLPRLVSMRIEAVIAGKTYTLPFDGGGPDDENRRAENIRVIATVRTGTEEEELVIETDVAFGEYSEWSMDEALPIITASSDITPFDLAGLMKDGFFWPSDDVDADSRYTQEQDYERAAFGVATEVLVSPAEAVRVRLIAAASDLRWQLPKGQTATIVITNGAPPEVQIAETVAS